MRLCSGMLSAALLVAAPVAAQSLDYGSFEGLFDEPVTSSATGKPERLSDSAVTMDIITAEDIRRSGARDLASLLRVLPGIVDYRGFNGSGAFTMGALLLNGREIYTASFNQLLLDALPVELDEIRQIELVHGPQSALYGFNAGEGVINIITYDAAQTPINEAIGRVGSQARRDGALMTTLPLADGVAMRVTAAGDHAHEVGDVPLRGLPMSPVNPDRQSLAANFSAHLANGDHATAEISHSDLTVRSMVPEVAAFLDLRLQSDSVKADYSADTVVGLVGAMVSYGSQIVPQAASSASGWFAIHDHTVDGKLSDLLKLNPTDSLRFEVEIRNEDVHSSSSLAGVNNRLWGGSAMWDHRFSSDLTFVNVVRYIDSTTSQGEPGQIGIYSTADNHGISDNSALLYKVSANDDLRLSFSRGIDLPSQLAFAQLGLGQTGNRKSSIAGNPDLTIASVTEYRLTWDHRLPGQGIAARLSLFNRLSDDVLGLYPLQLAAAVLPACQRPTIRTALTCKIMAREGGLSGVTDGLELEIGRKGLTGLSWGLTYSIENQQPHPTANALVDVPALADSQTFQKLHGEIGYGWGEWRADLRADYSSPVRILALQTVPAPAVGLMMDKDVLTVAPHLTWQPRSDLSFELAADNLWTYKTNLLQRIPATTYATVKWFF